jgi:flagellar protein FliO/FliZ
MNDSRYVGGGLAAPQRTPSSAATRSVARQARNLRSVFVLLALSFAAPAFAADDNKVIYPGGAKADSTTVMPGGSLNTVTLVVGLLLAGVGGWLVYRNRRGTPVGRDLHALAISETRSLGNRQYLVVASYEGKKFLLGVCPGSINMLTALPEAPEAEDEA